MDWIESQINDESLFPVTTDIPFPKAATYTCTYSIVITETKLQTDVYFQHCYGSGYVGPVTFSRILIRIRYYVYGSYHLKANEVEKLYFFTVF